MPFVALQPRDHVGQVIGDGHCVAFVRRAVPHLPPTSRWIQGAGVWEDEELPTGTAIATFSARGTYDNKTDGSSHAAIFLERDDDGILVLDQWVGRIVTQRFILYKGGGGPPADDADAYSVIEVA